MIIRWNGAIMVGKLDKVGAFSITVKFRDKRDNFSWRCTSVYGPTARAHKQIFWEELRSCGGDPMIPWIICGDFNAIFTMEDKPSGAPNLQEIRIANRFMWDLRLCEPPTVGRRYTWTNGQRDPIWVKLDRFQVNSPWSDRFPRMLQKSLPRLGLDHVPIRLEVGEHFSTPRSFRLELVWYTVEGFREMVQKWWKEMTPVGCGAYVISKKLAGLRDRLRVWAKESFGSIKLKKLDLLQEVERLDIIKESRCLSSDEVVLEQHLFQSLETIRKQEEIYRRQRSRLQWLKEGDNNTKFFQAVANVRKCRNLIPGISQDGNLVFDPRGIGRIFMSRFQ